MSKMFDDCFAKAMGLDTIPNPRNDGDRKLFNEVREKDPFVSFSARIKFNQTK